MVKKIIKFICSLVILLTTLNSPIFAKYVIENNITAAEINIDRTKPVGTVIYSTKEETNDNVTVNIILSEPIYEIEGWNLSEDGLTLDKTYEQDTIEVITIVDMSANENTVEISVQNIKK